MCIRDSLSADNITAASVSAIDAAVTATTLTASADVTVVNGALTATGTDANASSVGALTLTDSQANLGDMTVIGATAVTGGSLQAQSLTVGDNSTFTNGAKVNVGSLDAGGKVITVGQASDTKSTSLVAETLTLGGGSLLIDPDWTADGPNTVTALSIGAVSYTHLDVYKRQVQWRSGAAQVKAQPERAPPSHTNSSAGQLRS